MYAALALRINETNTKEVTTYLLSEGITTISLNARIEGVFQSYLLKQSDIAGEGLPQSVSENTLRNDSTLPLKFTIIVATLTGKEARFLAQVKDPDLEKIPLFVGISGDGQIFVSSRNLRCQLLENEIEEEKNNDEEKALIQV